MSEDAAVIEELEEQEAEPEPPKAKTKAAPKAKRSTKQETQAKQRRMREERERIERELDEGNELAEKSRARAEGGGVKKKTAAAKVRGGKPKATRAHGARIDDDEALVALMARYVKKDPAVSWSGVIKSMRGEGHAVGQSRARRLFPQAQKAAGSKVKSR